MNGLYTPHTEMGSSTSSSSSDSLNGLKFGRKIYFGDVGFVVPAKSGGGSSLSAAAAAGQPPPKKGRTVVQGGKPPICVVEGCNVDLSDAKTYYSRHKVCGMHSKSPKVIVAGLEQRFCQQCSRFHQLPEFDQGKRSCRRRLAGHNERRRKPPPGSLFSSCYGYRSSSIFASENNGRTGAFLVDFTAYPRSTGKDSWPTAKDSEAGNFLTNPWQTNSENPPPDLFLQDSTGGTRYPGPGVPSGECFTGVSSDSGCALSLLSNQPNGSRNHPPSTGLNSSPSAEGTSVIYQTSLPCAAFPHFSSNPWGFRVIEASGSSHKIGPDLGLSQISESGNGQYSGECEGRPQSGRKCLEFDHSRIYDSSTQNMNWSL